MSKNQTSSLDNSHNQVRLDKWLWAARFYKTRSIARDMIQGGKVHYNNQRGKPSKIVEIGATIKLLQGYQQKIIVIDNITDQRRSASLAETLYHETPESLLQREKEASARKLNSLHSPRPVTKPDKKQRRQIIQFKSTNNS